MVSYLTSSKVQARRTSCPSTVSRSW